MDDGKPTSWSPVVDFNTGRRDEPIGQLTDQQLLKNAFQSSVTKKKETMQAWYSDRCRNSQPTCAVIDDNVPGLPGSSTE